ncbi:ATP-dependent DNA helicase PIF1-like protein [Tanacetum coccineum]
MKLNFHLPNQYQVTLRDSECLSALLERESINVTMFTDWFDLNERHPPARTFTYAEIPKHYVWHEPSKMGPRTFEELLTVNKRLCTNFKEACFAYGLLNDDREWTRAIQEASLWALGPQLRDLFVTILLFCDIASLLLPAGRIAHSRFVIPLELLENSTCGIKQNTHLAELMQEFKLVIWDEAPMTQKYAFKALDKTLRDILGYPTSENRNKFFGGMTVLLGVILDRFYQ